MPAPVGARVESVARVLGGLDALRGQVAKLQFIEANVTEDAADLLSIADALDRHIGDYLKAAEAELTRVVDFDAEHASCSDADDSDRPYLAELASMQCGLAAFRLEVQTLISGVDAFVTRPTDAAHYARLQKRLARAERTLGEFALLRERSEAELRAVAGDPTSPGAAPSDAPEPDAGRDAAADGEARHAPGVSSIGADDQPPLPNALLAGGGVAEVDAAAARAPVEPLEMLNMPLPASAAVPSETPSAPGEPLARLEARLKRGLAGIGAIVAVLFTLTWLATWFLTRSVAPPVPAPIVRADTGPSIAAVEARLDSVDRQLAALATALQRLETPPPVADSALATGTTTTTGPAPAPTARSKPSEPIFAPASETVSGAKPEAGSEIVTPPRPAPESDSNSVSARADRTVETTPAPPVQTQDRAAVARPEPPAVPHAPLADPTPKPVARPAPAPPETDSPLPLARKSVPDTRPPAAASAADASADVLGGVRYGLQLGAFQRENRARAFARDNQAPGRELYLYRTGQNGKMYAVIVGLFDTNQAANAARAKLPTEQNGVWLRRFEPGERLIRYQPQASD